MTVSLMLAAACKLFFLVTITFFRFRRDVYLFALCLGLLSLRDVNRLGLQDLLVSAVHLFPVSPPLLGIGDTAEHRDMAVLLLQNPNAPRHKVGPDLRPNHVQGRRQKPRIKTGAPQKTQSQKKHRSLSSFGTSHGPDRCVLLLRSQASH